MHIVLQVPLGETQMAVTERQEREIEIAIIVCVYNTFYVVYKSVHNPHSKCGREQGERERTELSSYGTLSI